QRAIALRIQREQQFRPLAIVYVDRRPEPALDPAVGIVCGSAAGRYPAVGARMVPEAVIDLVSILRAQCPLPRALSPDAVVGMEPLCPVVRGDRAGRDADEIVPGLVEDVPL